MSESTPAPETPARTGAGQLVGRVALVTGAASGMGAATARLLAAEGALVVVADVAEEAGAAVAAEIVAAGGDAVFHRVDVARAADVEALVQAAVGTYGRLDCAVNNAAVAPDTRPLAHFDEDHFDRIVAIDLKGVALCLKYELRQLLAQGGPGSIVNISSVNGVRPQPNSAAYTAAKHGVIGLTKVASLENAPHGIRVNAVCPGAIDTPMLRGALARRGANADEFVPVLSLLGRVGRPEEVAEASLWLCSDRSSYVTGAVLPVDAGYLSR